MRAPTHTIENDRHDGNVTHHYGYADGRTVCGVRPYLAPPPRPLDEMSLVACARCIALLKLPHFHGQEPPC